MVSCVTEKFRAGKTPTAATGAGLELEQALARGDKKTELGGGAGTLHGLRVP
jgi:hypothetical protein